MVSAVGGRTQQAPPTDVAFRSGSAVSILTTINGLYLRRAGGWLPSAALVDFAVDAGVAAPLARTAIARLKKRGVLEAERRDRAAGYALSDSAMNIIVRGDSRILSPRVMTPEDRWCLVSFSIPETQRQLRGRLRRRLELIGCGMVSAALWIAPDFLRPEIEAILVELHAREYAVLFVADAPQTAGSLSEAVSEWWDLREIAELHQSFVEVAAHLLDGEPVDDRDAFRRFVTGIDAWRPVPYLDPGLPHELLPADWPGLRSARQIAEVISRFQDRAAAHVAARLDG